MTSLALLAAAMPLLASGSLERLPYSWNNVEIVAGGFITGIQFHARQRDLIYCRTDIGGAYRWNPTARRWTPLQDWIQKKDWSLYGVESLALDPSDPRKLYLACGTYTNNWSKTNGAILRSSDRGRSFLRTDMPYKMGGNEEGRSMGERLAVDPNLGRILFFGSRHNGLWMSADSGATWRQSKSFPVQGRTNGVGIPFVVFDRSSGRRGSPSRVAYVGIASNQTHLYCTQDAGTSWKKVPGQPIGLMPHQARMATDGTLYLTYGDRPGPNGMTDGAVWKFDTRRGRWTDITPIRPNRGPEKGFGYAGLALGAGNSGTVLVTTMDRWEAKDELLRSDDGGKTWFGFKDRAVMDPSASPYLLWGRAKAEFGHWMGALALDPFDDRRVLYGTGATIWGSTNARRTARGRRTDWKVFAQGIEETAVLGLVSPPEGPHLISALGDIGGFTHDDLTVSPRGGMWLNPLMSNTDCMDFAAHLPRTVVRVGRGSTGSHGAYSTDGARTWQPFASQPQGVRGGGSVAISSDARSIVWSPNGSVPHRSTDQGTTWVPCLGLASGARVLSDRSDPEAFYATDGEGTRVFVSADGGATFSVGASLPEEEEPRWLRAVPGKPGQLWHPRESGLHRSDDGGRTFVSVAGLTRAESVGFGKPAPGRTYPTVFATGIVSGQQGVFRSIDEGKSWVRINDERTGFGTMNVIIGDPRVFGRVYLGTNGRGILVGEPRDIR